MRYRLCLKGSSSPNFMRHCHKMRSARFEQNTQTIHDVPRLRDMLDDMGRNNEIERFDLLRQIIQCVPQACHTRNCLMHIIDNKAFGSSLHKSLHETPISSAEVEDTNLSFSRPEFQYGHDHLFAPPDIALTIQGRFNL